MVAESRGLVPLQRQSSEDTALAVPTFEGTVQQAKERLEALRSFVKSQMIEGEDYGKIPGAPKPTLLKPGAEKLAEIYGFTKQVDVFPLPYTWEDNESGHAQYTIKVVLMSKRSGQLEAEGIGSCNTREKRFKARDGSGFRDPWTERNSALKMAKKRALIDAVLSATRSSGLFTQDPEDLADDDAPARPSQSPRHESTRPVQGPAQAATLAQKPLTTCADCGKTIVDVQIGAKVYKATSVEQGAIKEFGRALCYSCGQREAAKRQGQAHEAAVQGQAVPSAPEQGEMAAEVEDPAF